MLQFGRAQRRCAPGLTEPARPPHLGGRGVAQPGVEIEARSGASRRRLLSSAPIYRESHPALQARLGSPELGSGSEFAKEFDHQENFSAEEALPAQDARVSGPDVDPRGSPRHQASSSEGTAAPDTRAGAVKTKYRLRHSADFQAVRAERTSAGDGVLRLRVRANYAGHPRVGVVVTKRLGGAVVRNRVRRRLQAAARAQLGAVGAYDVVLTPQPAATTARFETLSASLARALLLAGAAQ